MLKRGASCFACCQMDAEFSSTAFFGLQRCLSSAHSHTHTHTQAQTHLEEQTRTSRIYLAHHRSDKVSSFSLPILSSPIFSLNLAHQSRGSHFPAAVATTTTTPMMKHRRVSLSLPNNAGLPLLEHWLCATRKS